MDTCYFPLLSAALVLTTFQYKYVIYIYPCAYVHLYTYITKCMHATTRVSAHVHNICVDMFLYMLVCMFIYKCVHNLCECMYAFMYI